MRHELLRAHPDGPGERLHAGAGEPPQEPADVRRLLTPDRLRVAVHEVASSKRVRAHVVHAGRRGERGQHGTAEVVGVYDVRPALGRAEAERAPTLGGLQVPTGERVVADDRPEPEYDADSRLALVLLDVRLAHGGRLGRWRDRHGRVLVHPLVPLVGVQERHALLYQPTHTGL